MTPYCAKQASRSHKALSIAAATTSQKLSLHVNNLDRASGHAGVLSQLSQHKRHLKNSISIRHRYRGNSAVPLLLSSVRILSTSAWSYFIVNDH